MLKLYVSTIEMLQAFKDESGATAVEYALLAAGIALFGGFRHLLGCL